MNFVDGHAKVYKVRESGCSGLNIDGQTIRQWCVVQAGPYQRRCGNPNPWLATMKLRALQCKTNMAGAQDSYDKLVHCRSIQDRCAPSSLVSSIHCFRQGPIVKNFGKANSKVTLARHGQVPPRL